MSSRKADQAAYRPVLIKSRQRQFTLPPDAVWIRRSGLEFISPSPIPLWREMTVELEPPGKNQRVCCTGVVVACQGDRHKGYLVMMHLTGLSRETEDSLNLAYSFLA